VPGASGAWIDSGLVFTTPARHPDRTTQFQSQLRPPHGSRRTCGSLLAPLTFTPESPCRSPAQRDRRHHGDLHRVPFGRHPRCAQEARPVAR
jgi:hypothetical protein